MGSLEQGWKRKRREEGVEEKRGTEGETHIGIAKEGWMIKSPPPFPPAAPVAQAIPLLCTDTAFTAAAAAATVSPSPFLFSLILRRAMGKRKRKEGRDFPAFLPLSCPT